MSGSRRCTSHTAWDNVFRSQSPAFTFRTLPYRRYPAHFFLKRLRRCFTAETHLRGDSSTLTAGTPRVAGAWLRSIRAAAASALIFSSEAARCNLAEGGGGSARVETACGLFSILLLRPKAACMFGARKSRKTRKCNGYPEKKSPAAPGFFFGWQQNAACRTAPLRVRLRKCSANIACAGQTAS